jgi:TatA/E family protein of Tat protein translocase
VQPRAPFVHGAALAKYEKCTKRLARRNFAALAARERLATYLLSGDRGMGSLSLLHWFAVALVVLVLFGPRRLVRLAKSVGEGLRDFIKGVADARPH